MLLGLAALARLDDDAEVRAAEHAAAACRLGLEAELFDAGIRAERVVDVHGARLVGAAEPEELVPAHRAVVPEDRSAPLDLLAVEVEALAAVVLPVAVLPT